MTSLMLMLTLMLLFVKTSEVVTMAKDGPGSRFTNADH